MGDSADNFSFPSLPQPKLPPPLTSQSTAATIGSVAEDGKPQQVILAASSRKPGRPGKVFLEKGYSQVDWLRLTKSGDDLSGLGSHPPRKNIPRSEVRQHNTVEDGWMILNGRVFNMTPYLSFHPGGVDILKPVLGRDGTSLFKKYHPWVNLNALMSMCMVGSLDPREL